MHMLNPKLQVAKCMINTILLEFTLNECVTQLVRTFKQYFYIVKWEVSATLSHVKYRYLYIEDNAFLFYLEMKL